MKSKFRDKLSLSENDFGFVQGGQVQQSHSNLNKPRFVSPTCLPHLPYDTQTIIRTATLLDKDGTLKLYEIRDKGNPVRIRGEYASESPLGWNIRKAYDQHIKTKVSDQ